MSISHFLDRIGDSELAEVVDSIGIDNADTFEIIREKFSKYDSWFLWILAYSGEGYPHRKKYLAEGYEKFLDLLDPGFPKKLASHGDFISRMWELILCDVLSASGKLIPKGEAGADFILETPDGNKVQIEAVAPNEAEDKKLRAEKPNYTKENNFFELGGKIHDLELPIVLRALQGFNDKKDGYNKGQPLIIAINSYNAVGLTSDDDYVLRRFLFGLGNLTLTKRNDGSFEKGFEQLPRFKKPGQDPFLVAYFRRPEYAHISGVLYTSQNPVGFIPGTDAWSWHNSGITFTPNPMATHPVSMEMPFFRKLICNTKGYQVFEPEKKFESSVSF